VDWLPMDTAPQDGSWIEGRNETGRSAKIQSRELVPGLRIWCEGDTELQGHWIKNTCFYPVEWRPVLNLTATVEMEA
jgi:hypothetical protein